MRVSEVFYSIQGEGKLAGVPSVFIRTSGCNLRCTWCDTPYTSWSPEGEARSIPAILDQVSKFETRYVVVTGGEPLIADGIEELTRSLRARGCHVTIETAATVWADVVCDLASLSPKLASSTPRDRENGRFAETHESHRINIDTIRRCMALGDYQLKFVIDRENDLSEIDELLVRISEYDPGNVLLMPQGVTREELDMRSAMVAEMCKKRGFRYCPRLHIELYGNVRGT